MGRPESRNRALYQHESSRGWQCKRICLEHCNRREQRDRGTGTTNNTTTFGVLWDTTYLYVGMKVLDDTLYKLAIPWSNL